MTPQTSKTLTFEDDAIVEVGGSSKRRLFGLSSFVRPTFLDILGRTTIVDLLPLAFFVVIVRQYFWPLSSQQLAWTLSFLVAGCLWVFYLNEREEQPHTRSKSFWLIVAAPLLFSYLMSVAHPDTSFDVLNYHLVNAERGLRGWPFIAGDFFPTILQVNPAPDMVSALFRRVLGYRLGTIVNYLAMLWIAMIVDKFLRPYLRNNWLRAVAVLTVVSTEMLLYLQNYYLIDLFALPLLLEATYLTINFSDLRKKNYAVVQIACFLGLSVAFKITNVAFAGPIFILCAVNVFRSRKEIKAGYFVVASLLLVAPALPFAWVMFRETGNPAFPLLNAVFKSPYLAPHNWEDVYHGPKKWWEYIIWPVLTVIYPERLSEMSGLITGYTGRIAVAFVVSILGLPTRILDSKLRTALLVLLTGSVIWTVTTGNGRYGLYLELMGGIAAICVLVSVVQSQLSQNIPGTKTKAVTVAFLFGGLLVTQSAIAYHHVYQQMFLRNSKECNRKLSLVESMQLSIVESRNLLNDYSASKYLTDDQRQKLNQVDVWVNSCYTSNGIEIMLKPDIPMISVSDYIDTFDLLETPGSQQRLAQTIDSLRGKRMFTLVPKGGLLNATKFTKRAGLKLGPSTPFNVPYFSYRNHGENTQLIELIAPNQDTSQTSSPH